MSYRDDCPFCGVDAKAHEGLCDVQPVDQLCSECADMRRDILGDEEPEPPDERPPRPLEGGE